jgi:hypothetical protein
MAAWTGRGGASRDWPAVGGQPSEMVLLHMFLAPTRDTRSVVRATAYESLDGAPGGDGTVVRPACQQEEGGRGSSFGVRMRMPWTLP